MLAFLEHGRVVNDQHSVAAPDELICLNQQFTLHRGWIPDPSRDKMVQLIVTTGRNPLGHLAECSCDHQDRLAPTRRPGTSDVASYRPTNPETALASVLDHSSNRVSPQSWSALQKPTTQESLKN